MMFIFTGSMCLIHELFLISFDLSKLEFVFVFLLESALYVSLTSVVI